MGLAPCINKSTSHCGMPFWWFYPAALRRFFLSRWRGRLPAWTKMVEETRVLTRAQLERLFPEAEVYVERFLGIPKSYALFVRAGNDGSGAITSLRRILKGLAVKEAQEPVLIAGEFEAGKAYGSLRGETSRFIKVELTWDF